MLHRKHFKMLKFPWDVSLLDYPLGCSQDYGHSVNLVSELQKWMNMAKAKQQKLSVKINTVWSQLQSQFIPSRTNMWMTLSFSPLSFILSFRVENLTGDLLKPLRSVKSIHLQFPKATLMTHTGVWVFLREREEERTREMEGGLRHAFLKLL